MNKITKPTDKTKIYLGLGPRHQFNYLNHTNQKPPRLPSIKTLGLVNKHNITKHVHRKITNINKRFSSIK